MLVLICVQDVFTLVTIDVDVVWMDVWIPFQLVSICVFSAFTVFETLSFREFQLVWAAVDSAVIVVETLSFMEVKVCVAVVEMV